MNPARRVFKNSAALTLSTLLERGVAFLLPVYVARFIGRTAWGEFNTAQSFTLIAISLSYWGFQQYIPREVARNNSRSGAYLGSALVIVAFTSTVFVLLSLWLVDALDYAPSLDRLIKVGLLTTVLFSAEAIIFESVISALERMEWIALARFPATTLRTMAGLWLLANGAEIAVLFWLLGGYYLLTSSVYAWLLWRNGVRIQVQTDLIRELTVGAIPFVLVVVAGETFNQIDRVFISKIVNVEQVGVYATGVLFVQVAQMVAPAVMGAIFPLLSRLFLRSEELFVEVSQRLFRWLFVGMFPFVLTLIALAPLLIVGVFSADYLPSIPILQIAALSLLPMLSTRLLYRIILASNNERLALPVAIARSSANILLNLLLLPRFGIIGAAVALIGLELSGLILNYRYVAKHIMPLPLGELIVRPVICCLVGGGVFWGVRPISPLLAYVAALSAFLVTTFATNTLTRSDWQFLRRYL